MYSINKPIQIVYKSEYFEACNDAATKPIEAHTIMKRVGDVADTIEYRQVPEFEKNAFIDVHRHNVSTVATAVWRIRYGNVDAFGSKRIGVRRKVSHVVPEHTLHGFACDLAQLFPYYSRDKVAHWWIKALDREDKLGGVGIYKRMLGRDARHYSRLLPQLRLKRIDEGHVALLEHFYNMLGFPVNRDWTYFTIYIDIDTLNGSLKECYAMLSAIPNRLRSRCALYGSKHSDVLRLATKLDMRASPFFSMSLPKSELSVNTDLHREMRATWEVPGMKNNFGTIFTDLKLESDKMKRVLDHHTKNKWDTVLLSQV